MENVNKRRPNCLSLSKLECGLQEIINATKLAKTPIFFYIYKSDGFAAVAVIDVKVSKTLFTLSEGPRSSGVSFFCFVSPRA